MIVFCSEVPSRYDLELFWYDTWRITIQDLHSSNPVIACALDRLIGKLASGLEAGRHSNVHT